MENPNAKQRELSNWAKTTQRSSKNLTHLATFKNPEEPGEKMAIAHENMDVNYQS